MIREMNSHIADVANVPVAKVSRVVAMLGAAIADKSIADLRHLILTSGTSAVLRDVLELVQTQQQTITADEIDRIVGALLKELDRQKISSVLQYASRIVDLGLMQQQTK